MDELINFLSRYSDIDVPFIKDFIQIREGDKLHYPFTIDLDIIVGWLKTNKWKLKATLLKTYRENIDYILLNPKVERDHHKYGGQNKELILLTSDTFKLLCLKSKTKEAEKVRYYYITLEKLVEIYKDEIIAGQKEKIEKLERNLKKIKYPVKGALYIIKVSDDGGYKVGKTKDMNKRYDTYKTSHKDDPDIAYVFYSHDIYRLEKCVNVALQYYQYRNRKEFYNAKKEEIIEAINKCQDLISRFECKDKDCQKNDGKSLKKLSRHIRNNNDDNIYLFKTHFEYDIEQIGGSHAYENTKRDYINLMSYKNILIESRANMY